MTKKIVWILISLFMVLTLILTSCDTTKTEQTVEEDEGDDVVKITETETGGTVKEEEKEQVIQSSDIPQYGGTHTIALAFDVTNWANGLEFC